MGVMERFGRPPPEERTLASMEESTAGRAEEAEAARAGRGASGVRASTGLVLSNSLTWSINSMGVMPQMASGEKTLMRRETAPTSLPSM